jgi:lipopolysaccharide/colanic/teichoic acid biosynthesis glycosyltransferase
VAAKRFLDLFLTTLLVVLLAPIIVFLFAAMTADFLLKREDRGGFFYRETRVSQGREFELLKFRTLRTEILADMRRNGAHARLYEADPANLTWAGRRLLKPRYLDELPQLVNIFRGEMSLVGPRPWPPAMVERQIAAGRDYRIRIPAGLTGPAQVTKGEGLRYEDLDTEYLERIESLSSWGLVRYDLQILRRTLGTIARGEGLNF